jgi:hypothetical protein
MLTESVLFDEREAARRLGLSVATIRRRRLLRLPPAWVKLGGRVLYRPQDLVDFIDANVVELSSSVERGSRLL